MRPKRHKPGEEMEPVEVYARVKAIPEYDDRKRVILSFIIFHFVFYKKYIIYDNSGLLKWSWKFRWRMNDVYNIFVEFWNHKHFYRAILKISETLNQIHQNRYNS